MINTLLDIILIESNPADAELTLYALQEYNFGNKIKVLRNGAEALNHIFKSKELNESGISARPSVILLNLHLPKMNGFELLKIIRTDKRTEKIPVVVLNASPVDKRKLEENKLSVNYYVDKPLTFERFSRALAHVGYYWTVLNKKPIGASR